ncbi:MAG: MFS transporter [Candidatus Cloacimonadota bacterium]|nr:MFS transporter [Candidatus Cloacimonadota bacterium]
MKNKLTQSISNKNYNSFIWHGVFLALAVNFTDMHTIIPAMLIKAGANSILLGLLTTILMGGGKFVQIIFAGTISNKSYKKKSLLLGINLRVIALFLLAFLLFISSSLPNYLLIILIFVFMTMFSFSGSYASIAYVDLTGKTILSADRKKFFSFKQSISSIGILISAILAKIILNNVPHPYNYGVLFIIAGILLFVASLGFWRITEFFTDINKKLSFIEYLKHIPLELKKNRNLKNYLFIINNLGLGMSFIPFMVLFAKKNFDLSNEFIGNILLYKVLGILVTSLILYKRSNHFDYKKLLYFSLLLGILLPFLCLIFQNNYFIFQLIFILSGVFLTTFKISQSGILIEISNNENRAKYAGISGAGSILPAIVPLLSGLMISFLGFTITFVTMSFLISLSFIFIHKLECKN